MLAQQCKGSATSWPETGFTGPSAGCPVTAAALPPALAPAQGLSYITQIDPNPC